jgi:hypothetical protein
VTDAELTGHWSDDRLQLGSMEASDLLFMPDGVGWSLWSNALGCEQVLFRWSARDQRLLIAAERYARLEGGTESLVLVDEQRWDETIDTAFAIRPGQDAVGNSVTLLELDEHVSFGDRFAFVSQQLQREDDPAGWMLR